MLPEKWLRLIRVLILSYSRGKWRTGLHRFSNTLCWLYIALWKEAGWGWGLWCFRGSFGIVDSGRADITYENFKGHKLDRQMLELLREF